MKDLFTPLTRDERQAESLNAWLRNKGRGCVEGCTGYVELCTGNSNI